MNRFSMMAVVCLMFVFGCGVSEAVSRSQDITNPLKYRSADELKDAWGPPCWVKNNGGGSETWAYCILVGNDGTERHAQCTADCPRHYDFALIYDAVVGGEWVVAP